jgi:hypothetical protein
VTEQFMELRKRESSMCFKWYHRDLKILFFDVYRETSDFSQRMASFYILKITSDLNISRSLTHSVFPIHSKLRAKTSYRSLEE